MGAMNNLLTVLLFCMYMSVPVAIFALFMQGSKKRWGLSSAAALAVLGAVGAILVRTLLL